MNTIDRIIKNAIVEKSQYKDLKVAYEMDNDLNEVIIQGRVKFLDDYGDEDVQSEVFVNPTYLDLAIFVNDRINITQDDHHVFLEKMYKHSMENEGQPEETQIIAYELGS